MENVKIYRRSESLRMQMRDFVIIYVSGKYSEKEPQQNLLVISINGENVISPDDIEEKANAELEQLSAVSLEYLLGQERAVDFEIFERSPTPELVLVEAIS